MTAARPSPAKPPKPLRRGLAGLCVVLSFLAPVALRPSFAAAQTVADDEPAEPSAEDAPPGSNPAEPAPPDLPDIAPADQDEATRQWNRFAIDRLRRPTRAQIDAVLAWRRRFPGAAEAPVAIRFAAESLTRFWSRDMSDADLDRSAREIDALADLPGADPDRIAATLSDAFVERLRSTRRSPLALLEHLVARYGDGRVANIAERLRRVHAAQDAERERAADPEARRAWAARHAEMQRCIAECREGLGPCTGWQRRVRLARYRGRLVAVSVRRRVAVSCGGSFDLWVCQRQCGMSEDDPERVGEDD